ncbi:hypothetical protein [Pectinatus frisingensis]|uniref:hypothetical protein n=1 Tax=Pectinatus frisingensis TaxID=865 RepID=UPI0018C6BE41|nr:hypothetical protein [Pectinatus frisingensis]
MNTDFIVGFVSGSCIGAAIILFIWGFAGKANAQINGAIKNECIGYDQKGADK